jgi:CheY-like chemotaxis protein
MAPNPQVDPTSPDLGELEKTIAEMDQEISDIESRLLSESERLQHLKTHRTERASQLNDLRLQLVSGHDPIIYPKIILVADSDTFNRRFVRNIIEKLDHVPVEARSGREALAVTKQSPIDLILLDMDLDDIDGIKLVRVIREERGLTDVPIILITKALEKRHIVPFADHTIQGHLVRPIHRDMLTQLLEDLWSESPDPHAIGR